jgi:hypothetical protein
VIVNPLVCLALSIGLAPSQAGPFLEELAAPGNEQGVAATKDCGAFCMAIAGRRAGLERLSFETAKELVDSDGDGVCSLADLASGFERLGLSAAALRRKPDGLPMGLNILHVRSDPQADKPNHFIVSESLASGQFRFYIPPIGSGVEGEARILELWDGCYLGIGSARPVRAWFAGVVILAGLGLGVAAQFVFACRRRSTGTLDVQPDA